MGIATNLPEQVDMRVMFGNPFDNTITIERNGERITERLDGKKCKGCDRVHWGRFIKEI